MSVPARQIPELPIAPAERIPQLGFGVFQVPPRETEVAVAEALSAGYRHIDTAAAYRNEGGVGEALHASGLDATSCSSRPSAGTTTRATSRPSAHVARASSGSS